MPLQTAVNPQTNETVVLIDGAWEKAEQVATNPKDQSRAYLVGGKWLTDTGTAELPQPKTALRREVDAVGNAAATVAKKDVGLAETGLQLGSGMLATPVAGLAGLARGAVNLGEQALGLPQGRPAADVVQSVQQGMTYQPRTEAGQQMSGAVGEGLSYLTTKPGRWMGEHSQELAQKMGASPEVAGAVGATADTATQTIPQLLLGKGAGMGLKAARGATRGAEAGARPPVTPEGYEGYVREREKAYGEHLDRSEQATQQRMAGKITFEQEEAARRASYEQFQKTQEQAHRDHIRTPQDAARAATDFKHQGKAPPGAEPAAGAADTAEGRAKAYVDSLGLDWGKLSATFKDKLTGIATDAQALGRLKPDAVKRQALLAEVGIDNPTKGQVTREPLQRRAEAAVKATEAGEPLRALDLEHNRVLTEGVEKLRDKVRAESLPTGSKSTGDLPVGRAVQDTALRAKAATSKKNYDRLYAVARKTEPDAAVPVDSLYDLLGKNPHIQHLGWVNSWLKRAKIETAAEPLEGAAEGAPPAAPTRRPVTLNELNDLRAEANGVIKGGGTDAHYAGQVKEAIDAAMENVPEGAKAWKTAIDAYRRHQKEFKDQGAVRGLVEDKPHSSDRRVAIEETAKKTVTGRLEDLQKVKRSLLTGKDPAARAAGKVAWRDLKGWGLDYIRERMSRGPKNAEGEAHNTWVGLKRALDDIGDENLDELYGPTVRKQLRRYQEAAEALWTEPSTRVTGSPSFEKILAFIDRVGNVPGAGAASHVVAGAVKGVQKLGEIGKAGREMRSAQSTPLDDQLSATRRDVRRQQNLSNVKRYAGKTAPGGTIAAADASQGKQ